MSEDIVLDDLKQQESSVYSVVKENEYELPDYSSVRVTKQSQPPVLPVKKSNYQKVWSAPMIAIIVLQCLIMVLLMVAISMSGFNISTKDSSHDLTCGNSQNIVQSSCIPNITECFELYLFDKLSHNTCVTPNFDEWADGITKRIYGSNTSSFPNFTEWADGVAQTVIHKIEGNTPSFPNFTEWADDVAQTVIHKIEGNTPSFPNFTEWADGVAQTVIHKIEGNTPSFPNFTEWADGVAQTVIHKIEGNTPSFPNFTEWADGVAQTVIHRIEGNTPSFPNFTEWADGVAQNVIHKIEGNTPSFPNFTEWADGVAQNVIHKTEGNTPSFPNFTEWADHVTKNVVDNLGHDILTFSNFTDVIQSVYHLLLANISALSDSDAFILSVILDSINEHSEVLSTYHMNNTYLMIKSKDDLIEKLNGISVMLSNVQETSSSMASVVNDLLLGIEELLLLYNSSFNVLAQSCEDIKNKQNDISSGMYLLKNPNNGSTYNAYCNMDELCGSEGGWTRLAYLDMSDAKQNCPSGFRLYQSGGVRACGRPVTISGSCVSVQFPSNGISYSQVCGRVVGYQYASPDAVHSGNGPNHNNLNGDYVDGVSITHGFPRQHVWTLMAGNYEAINNYPYNCPCTAGSTQQVQSFIGNHYFCESGVAGDYLQALLYTTDPLWDGQDCRTLETACCSVPDLPWFHRDYGNTTTTDYLELRVCGDESTGNEDVPVGYYEIYIK